ncbi:MAG: CHAT domain-containing protein [Acidobacteriota bacterium]|nr:CHAT domain-containing protein [Acidobacteriota bacterium]
MIAALVLCACGRQRASNPEAEWRHAQQLCDAADYDGAMRIARAGIAAAGKQPASEWSWKFRLLQSEILFSQGSTQAALDLLRTPVSDVPHAAELEAQRLTDLGSLSLNNSEYEKAAGFLEQAQSLAGAFPESRVSEDLDLRRGLLALRWRKDFAEAEALFRGALRKANLRGDSYVAGSALGNLGFLKMKAARYDEALAFFERVLGLALPSPVHRAVTLANMGWCYYDLGDLDHARNLFDESDKLMAPIHSRYRSATLGGFGRVYYAREMYAEARIWFRKAADAARDYQVTDLSAEWFTYLAATSLELNDVTAAETYNREAGKVFAGLPGALMRGWQMLNAARIAEVRGDDAAAESGYRSVSESQLYLGARVAAGDRLALLLARLKRPEEARAEFARAADLVENKRAGMVKDEYKITYLASAAQLYRDYVEFLSSRNEAGEALRVAESSRARLLAEKLGREGAARSAPDLRAIQALARDTGTVFLCYWTAPRTSYLWVVTSTSLQQFPLPAENHLKDLVDSYNAAIRDRDLAATGHPAAGPLYEALIKPAEPYAATGSNVVIVPDGPLHRLNFEALLVPKPKPHYWIEDVTISVAPSLNVLTAATAAHPGQSLLLFGDPVSAGAQFPRLRHAADEIQSVEANFPAARTVAITGPAALPAAYAQANPRQFSTIHFVSHAVANQQSPLDSAVILSPGGDSFKLYARDVMNTAIDADLVTLSACESAGTRTYSGEGLVGFAWAFLQAGAHNVVAGLWPVDDASTALIMKQMYAGIHHGKSPGEALRDAKLALVGSQDNYRKPNYWAPFELFTRWLPKTRAARKPLSTPAGA